MQEMIGPRYNVDANPGDELVACGLCRPCDQGIQQRNRTGPRYSCGVVAPLAAVPNRRTQMQIGRVPSHDEIANLRLTPNKLFAVIEPRTNS
jgi:hypothetical protein